MVRVIFMNRMQAANNVLVKKDFRRVLPGERGQDAAKLG